MNEDIENIRNIGTAAGDALADIDKIEDLDAWDVKWLGKKSDLTHTLRSISSISSLEDRKALGEVANQIKNNLESASAEKRADLREVQITSEAQKESVDISLPGRPGAAGRIHPITQTIEEICDIFISLGFQVKEGPEVEWDYYNFEALNIPAEHPARDSMSTFWIDTPAGEKGRQLLRTHTTAVTARTLENNRPPIRAVEPGRLFRYEASDATHVPMFHQIDGIAVDKGITMGDLKGTLYEFSRRYFGADRKVRFRVDYFPFVEPGVEMAIECTVCKGSGCRLCKGSGWIEILGAGMTHPDVLRRAGIDPEEYTSFAFGMSIDRPHMLRYGVDDIRLYFASDLRFLRQF
jgi:phenylalanyl-tRNA synthetase alpha chain